MENTVEVKCDCPNNCERHGKCYECILNHKSTDSLPFCLFPENGGSKKLSNFYKFLKKRFDQ
jgi:hypothetical protein